MRTLRIFTDDTNSLKITPESLEIGTILGEVCSVFVNTANYIIPRLDPCKSYIGKFTENRVELNSDSMYYVFNYEGILLRATRYEKLSETV